MSNGSSVLVAGGGGFIGGWLVKRLLEDGYRVRSVDLKPLDEWHQVHPAAENLRLDLADLGNCRSAVTGVDQVFNLAADMGGMGFIEANKAACMLSVLINTHLLMASQEVRVSRFFFSSSACVYNADKQSSPDVTALRESDAYPAMPEDGYGWEKLFSERMCRHFTEDYGLETRVARYHNIYGPLGTWEGGREKAPAALCRKVAEAKLLGQDSIPVWGDGEQTRSFTYISDCIDGTLHLMASDCREPLNIGSSELVSINEMLGIIEEIAGIDLHHEHDLTAPQGVRGRNSDNDLVSERLGWLPSISLQQGLTDTYAWIEERVRQGRQGKVAP